jgi:transcriptional regulator with XRE-family HTH domain
MLITPDQIRAARALLRMDQEELARRANVSIVTIRRSEASGGMGLVGLGTFDEIRRALEAAGAEFIERGVRRRKLDEEEAAALRRDLHAIAMRSAERQAELPAFTEGDLYDEYGL